MKKLGLTLAAFGFFFATTVQAQETETKAEVQKEVTTSIENDFEKIETSELPEAVANAVSTDFSGAEVEEAWVKEDEGEKVYKLKVVGQEEALFADAEGNWIDDEKKSKE